MSLPLHSALTIVTDTGDSACLMAISISGSIYLFIRSSGRAAAFLLVTLLLSAIFICFAKLAFLGCRSYFHHPDIHSPSGHAAMSAAVFWAFAILMRSQLEARRRILPLLVFSLLIAAIAMSRVWLGNHTPGEVLVGLAIGIISLSISYYFILRKKPLAPFDAYALVLWAVVPGLIIHGAHLPIETLIHIIAAHIKHNVALCGS